MLWRDESWLYESYYVRELSTYGMAQEAGCCQNTIVVWMKRFGIDRRTTSEADAIYKANNPHLKEVVSQQMLKKWQDDDYKAMQSAARKRAWEGDEARKKATIKRLTRIGEDHHWWTGGSVIVNCSWCDKEVKRPKYVVKNSNYAFCSSACKSNWWSENFKGELSPCWKEDKIHYPIEWTHDFREMVRERDNRECVLCGKTEKEQGQKLSVHHIDDNKITQLQTIA